MKTYEQFRETNDKILFESNEPVDIVIMGTGFDNNCTFGTTDDYDTFFITQKEKFINIDCDGSCTIMKAKDLTKNISKLGWDNPFNPEDKDHWSDVGGEIYLIKNFKGKIVLRIKIKDTNIEEYIEKFINTNNFNLKKSDVRYDDELEKYCKPLKNNCRVNVVVDVQGQGDTPIEITHKNFENLKLKIEEPKLYQARNMGLY